MVIRFAKMQEVQQLQAENQEQPLPTRKEREVLNQLGTIRLSRKAMHLEALQRQEAILLLEVTPVLR